MDHVVIIGNGISGITAARHIRKLSDKRITVISSESDHFFSRTALMYIYMGHMRYEHTKPYEDWFWKKNKIELLNAHVENVHAEENKINLSNGKELEYSQLVLATGSKSRMLNWPGQDLAGVQGLYSLQDLDLMENNTANVDSAVIVGGGLIGVEMAEMLHSRGIEVTILLLEDAYWGNVLPNEEANLIGRHLEKHGIEIKYETLLKEIQGENGRVKSVVTTKGEVIDCQFVGLTVGVQPNIDFLKSSGIELENGILVNDYLQTSHPNIFAIGDCAQIREPMTGRRAIEAVWYVGRMMGETLAATVCGEPTKYRPGNWFNSAKFFDIEYQTYGLVPPELPSGWDSFYWENKSGDKCLRIVFEKNSRRLIGINIFGIRIRHEIVDNWIETNRPIDFVVEKLHDANFDPEFYQHFEQQIHDSFKHWLGQNEAMTS